MSVEGKILEAGKGEELMAALRLLAETEAGGEPRFSVAVCRAVARVIVCRTYAPALLELCHLARAAAVLPGGYVGLFWAPGPLRPPLFLDRFTDSGVSSVFQLAGNGIELTYRDGTFSIAFGRMPFLAALTEFLVTTIGFTALDDALAPLVRPVLTAAELSAQANLLSRTLYDWLKDNLPAVQAQRKLALLVEFMKSRNGGDFAEEAIDDGAILDFWRSAAGSPDLEDFRTYRSVFKAFSHLRQAIAGADALNALEQAVPIGNDRERGEIDPEDIAVVVEAIAEEPNPLEALADPPASRIKFFNAKEREICRFLFECGRLADALPLSFMRCEVFGRAQARISQGIRLGTQGPQLAALIEASCGSDYSGQLEAFSALERHGRNVLLASAHLMDGAGLLTLPEGADILSFRTRAKLNPSPIPSETEGFREQGWAAAKGISRQGFHPADLARPEIREGYLAGVPLVAQVTRRIAGFLERLSSLRLPSDGWNAQFGEDKPVFTACFKAIYGGVT